MKVLNITETVVDGPHLRTSIYVSGCLHHCEGCHNPESWDFNKGEEMSVNEIVLKLDEIGNKYVTISGGDPLAPLNREPIAELVIQLKQKGYNVWLYTGYKYEYLKGLDKLSIQLILQNIDVLVDGPFIISLKDDNCIYRGSNNQRLIDIQESLKENKTILWKEC